MRKFVLAGVAALSLTACTTAERNTVTGAAVGAGAGAVIGGVATGSAEGALVGAAIGGASGAIIGSVANRPGHCYARDRYGRQIVVRCPPGY
ncbi:YMGG-like glycine zipper-containing protein [Faunimonas sp. B44]|uniref:YMGG-like glycine zipper-containing protein n=1 Tax=Faunimonas sp. B44 TaxID=3461493 RepID=UPI004043C59F